MPVAAGNRNVPPAREEQAKSGGLSTGTKLAIGAGAAALLCYKFGCFSGGQGDQAGQPAQGQGYGQGFGGYGQQPGAYPQR